MATIPRGGTDPNSQPLSARIGRALRRYFITGLATLFPVAVTTWLVVTIFRFADHFLGQYLGFQVPGLGLIVTVLVITGVGVFSVHFFGRAIFQMLDGWLIRLPLVKKIYPAVKQVAEFLFAEEGSQTAFRRVVLVEYPRLGAYTLAFVTNECETQVTGKPEKLLTILLPNPPSPFTGPLVFVPERDVIPVTLTVEDAVKFIVSGGVVASPLQLAQPRQPQ